MRRSVDIAIAGETLELHPQRAVIWRERSTVIVADTHFGKGAIFRQHGLAVPDASEAGDRERLATLLKANQARRLLILGDFVHAPLAHDSDAAAELGAWIEGLRPARVQVVAGNHDRGAARLWHAFVDWQEGGLTEGPFRFVHDMDASAVGSMPVCAGSGGFTLSGHVHPVVRLTGRAQRGGRLPAFWLRAAGLVLPAFALFTGGYAVKPGPRERLFAITEQAVVPL